MQKVSVNLYIIGFMMILAINTPAIAEESKFDVGFRGNVELANGTPANDILGYGLKGTYKLNDNWGIGFGIDQADYDLENPAKKLNLSSIDPKIIDAKTSSTMISVWGERYYPNLFSSSIAYVTFGLGINSIDVKNAEGDLSGGGTYDIKTDVGTDTVLLTSLGVKKFFTKTWIFDSSLGFRQHFGKWSMQDQNSSAIGTIDGFSSWILQLAVSRKF